jgi:hypothetical protein
VTSTPTPAPVDDDPVESVTVEGTPIDPQLLRLIQRVAHREHLLDGTVNNGPATRLSTTAPRSSARRRPAIGTVRTSTSVRAARGTTARKVTWS